MAACAAVPPDRQARPETDLRAHHCPSRRPVIRPAAEALAAHLAAHCPTCASPGWEPVDIVTGVPRDLCATRADDTRAEIDGCPACGHRAERATVTPDATADPGRCPPDDELHVVMPPPEGVSLAVMDLLHRAAAR